MSSYNVAAPLSSSVTLTGANFASDDYTLTAVLALRDCATSSWTTVTSAACVSSLGTSSLVGTIGLTVAGAVGTSSTVFSFDGALLFEAGHSFHLLPCSSQQQYVSSYRNTEHTRMYRVCLHSGSNYLADCKQPVERIQHKCLDQGVAFSVFFFFATQKLDLKKQAVTKLPEYSWKHLW